MSQAALSRPKHSPLPDRVKPGAAHHASRWVLSTSALLTTLGAAAWLQNRTIPGAAEFFDPVTPALGLAGPLVGGAILARHPRSAVGWLLCATGLASVSFFAEQYALAGGRPGAHSMAWLGGWTWLPSILLMSTLVLLLFPDGHPPSPRWKPLAWTALLLIAASTVLTLISTSTAEPSPSRLGPAASSGSRLAELAIGACAFVLSPLCLAALLARYRAAKAHERRQLKAFTVAAVVAVLAPAAGLVLPLSLHRAVSVAAVGALLGSVVVAMAQRGLFGADRRDVDRLTTQALVYASQVSAGVAIYRLFYWVLDTPSSVRSDGASLAAMLIVVGAWHPLHQLLVRVVERVLSPRRTYDALIDLGKRLESAMAPGDVVTNLAETVRSSLDVAYVAVEVGDEGETVAAAVSDAANDGLSVQDDVTVVPLIYQHEVVGRLIVAPHLGQQLDPTDLQLLHELAVPASPVLCAVRLTADLRRSKDRLVTAREEEWRRLRRELHDRLGPLSATRLGLKAAWNHLTRAKLDVAQAKVQELDSLLAGEIEHIRRLSGRLRPAALDDLDLVAVLREKISLWALPPPITVTLHANGLGRLPPDVAVAAYQIAVEAVTNAKRHGHARACEIRLASDGARVEVEVSDNGTGLPADYREGNGICDMRERAVELGGRCRVEARPEGGTIVSAEIPLRGNR